MKPYGSHPAAVVVFAGALLFPAALDAQDPPAGATIAGRVVDATTGLPLPGAIVSLEGSALRVTADSAGRYLLLRVPAGPQVLRAELLGYAATRRPLSVVARATVRQDLRLGQTALELEGISVTADAVGRARGELGTASVIESEAIRNQMAASLAGVLELLPGMVLRPPGLEGVQQVSLRSVPTTGGVSNTQVGAASASPAQLASFGTLIVMDGVPLSNNANLQSLGPRAELSFGSAAGGGIDLRRIPATTIDRVEVIRGIPSARYGDLTQGAIVVDTRAGVVRPDLALRYDGNTVEGGLVAGRSVGAANVVSVSGNLARTRVSPATSRDESIRAAFQLAHRARFGEGAGEAGAHVVADTRIDFFRVFQDSPERPEAAGRASWNRDRGLRVSHRLRYHPADGARFELSAAVDHVRQRSYTQAPRIRSAMPFTDRLTEGRAIGRYIGGQYTAWAEVDGSPWFVFSRIEAAVDRDALGFRHELRSGFVLRREWNDGPGYFFDIEFPPQSEFNGVQGFDRPRRYDDVPPVASSAFYVDTRATRGLGEEGLLQIQLGARAGVLHGGTNWFTGARAVALQPRFNVQVAPIPWLRLRGGWGITAKLPALAELYPAPQYNDIVNVNWYANDPAERLAVLTTFVQDPTNPELGFSRARKSEAGVEVSLGRTSALSLVAFDERVEGGVGYRAVPTFLLRERFALADTAAGTGHPPTLIEPPLGADTISILVGRPDNNVDFATAGIELTAVLPEIHAIRTRLEVQAAYVRTRFVQHSIQFSNDEFSDLQLGRNRERAPYWDPVERTGGRALVTYRAVHHQPSVGLVITSVVQHYPHEWRLSRGETDSLSFAGYITRAGTLVPVARADRASPEYRDLRIPRGIGTDRLDVPTDWFLSLQVMKTLPLDGRLSFYAFNALGRIGRFGGANQPSRIHPSLRFGLELSMPLPHGVRWQ